MLRAQDFLEDDDIDQPSVSPSETTPSPEVETQEELPPADEALSPAAEPAVPEPAVEPTARVDARPPSEQAAPDMQRQAKPEKAASPSPTASDEEKWGENRVLGGHQFPIGAFVPLALVTSYLGVRAGFEYHEVPGFEQLSIFGNQPRLVNLQTVNVREDIDFALRIHEYIAIFGNAYGRGRVGANIETLLGSGAEYTYGGDLGALVKIIQAGPFQLAVRGQAGYYTGQKAGVLTLYSDLSAIAGNAVTRLMNAPTLDLNVIIDQMNASFAAATADLLTPFDGNIFGVSLNLALALGKYVGVQLALGFIYDKTISWPTNFDIGTGSSVTLSSTVTKVRPSMSTALDFDAIALGVPIDFMLEYRLTPLSVSKGGGEGDISEFTFEHLVALSFFYSGRTDLQLGITGYTLVGQAPVLGLDGPSSGHPQDFGVQPVLRYFW